MSEVPYAPLIEALLPIRAMDAERRARLVATGQVASLQPGQRLAATQEHHWLLYVLDGELTLIREGQRQRIEAGSTRALSPVFEDGQLRSQAVVIRPVQLLRLDRLLYKSLLESPQAVKEPAEELDLSDTEGVLLRHFYQACISGTLELPAFPKVASRIQVAMDDPHINSARLARIVQMDLGVTGGLIRLANSALYRGAKPITNVRDAIIRLGMDITRGLVVSMAMQQVFKTDSPMLQQRMKELWNRSVHISALSFVIARHCRRLQPEQALLAGLLYDVGVVPILDDIGRHHRQVEDDELDAILIRLRSMVGELVVGYWGLGPEITQVVRESGNWYRDAGAAPDYCDIVLVARLYRLNQADIGGPVPRYHEVPAFARLGLATTQDQPDVLAEARDELAAVIGMLKGTGH